MPTYEFVCQKCGKPFLLTLSFSEFDKKDFKCPDCGSNKVEQRITTFQTKTSKKS